MNGSRSKDDARRRPKHYSDTHDHRRAEIAESKRPDGMDFWRWREKNPDASVFDAWQAGFDHARSGGIK